MNRRQIKLEKGAIRPIERGLWFFAFEKLEDAAAALEGMETATDRIRYEYFWATFVDSLQLFWVRFFDEGCRKFSAFQPWAGKIIHERDSDPLLKYLYVARNQVQHGRLPITWSEPRLILGKGFNGHLRGLRVFPDGTFESDATPLHPQQSEFEVENSFGKPELPTITNGKNKERLSYDPPRSHLGTPIQDAGPVEVATAALKYYRQKLSEAFEKFSNPTDDQK